MSAERCNAYIEKKWPGHRVVLWRRQCRRMVVWTEENMGYCHDHIPYWRRPDLSATEGVPK